MVLTREQLEERLAALHHASLELVQDISLDSLLERIAALACEQADARYAAVGVLDENGGLEKFIPVGLTPEQVAKMGHPPYGHGLIGELMHGQGPIRIPNIADHPKSSGFPPNHPPMRSLLGVPIKSGTQQLGQIYLTDKRSADEFSTNDQLVIETLAAYAAVAISNARLYRQLGERDQTLTRRNQDLALINDLASTLSNATDTDEIVAKALGQVVDYLALDAGEVHLRDENGTIFRQALHIGEEIPTFWNRDQFVEGDGFVGRTAKANQPCSLLLPDQTDPYLSRLALQNGASQISGFPLSTRSGVLGVLTVATRGPRQLDEREVRLLTSITAWVGTAIENVRLNVQGRRLAVLEERERIGMDLHDGIIQSIYAVGLTLEHARLLMNDDKQQARKRIDQAVSDLNATIRDIRAYILDLRPRQLHEENLIDGLKRLVAEFRANTAVEVNLTGPAGGLEKLPETAAIALFHICQEALANIAKHARATQVDIYLWTTIDRVLLEISDNGRGFEQSSVRLSLGHGLSNMYTRARHVGGDVEITSGPGEGTTILAWVPLPSS